MKILRRGFEMFIDEIVDALRYFDISKLKTG